MDQIFSVSECSKQYLKLFVSYKSNIEVVSFILHKSQTHWLLLRRVQVLRRQRQRLQKVWWWLDEGVSVVLKKAVVFLIPQRFAFYPYSTEPWPRQRRWVFVSFQQVPRRYPLFLWHLEPLFLKHITYRIRIKYLFKKPKHFSQT